MSSDLPPERAPRWATPRGDRPSHGALFDQVASVLGVMLYAWQRLVADVALEIDPATNALRYRTVGVSVARQNGKTLLVLIRIALELIRPNRVVAYTAQDRNYARRQWQHHCDLLMAIPAFAREVRDHVKANGQETLVMRNGSMYLILTPNEDAARSLTVDLAVIDEAYSQHSMAIIGALQPTMVTRPSAQLWVLSNAGHHGSVLFRHYTDRGRDAIGDPSSTLAWFEWATRDGAELFDHDAWADANPALGLNGGPLIRALEAELLDSGEDVFRREHLNQWHDDGAMGGIDPVTWAACRRDDVLPGERVAFALDFTPERDRGALVACGEQLVAGELITPLEVVEAGADLERIIGRAVEVANAWDGTITIDRGSPAASVIPALERLTARDDGSGGHRVRLIPQTELVRASGDFHDAARLARISHRGDYRLTDAVTAATKRRIGDAWTWNRRGGDDITPLVAATLARWAIVAAPDELIPAVW